MTSGLRMATDRGEIATKFPRGSLSALVKALTRERP
jgi:hypothetical protein